MLIRSAKLEDSMAVVSLLRRSIIELCVADHKSDPTALDAWLRNKTSDNYRAWIANEKLIKIVVEREEVIAGFGMAATDGEVLLNYVAPEFRFAGVSKLVLEEIERSLIEIGIEEARLWSTQTAHTFYRSRDWVDRGNPEEDDGMLSYPMWKSLTM